MHSQRRIRSFVLRAGRVTAAQERALAELWPAYGLDFTGGPLDLNVAFGRAAAGGSAPRCLEIGFGTGEVLGALAEANPHIDYLGIEVHRSGVGRLLLRAAEGGLSNVRVICDDAVEVLSERVADDSFDEIRLVQFRRQQLSLLGRTFWWIELGPEAHPVYRRGFAGIAGAGEREQDHERGQKRHHRDSHKI